MLAGVGLESVEGAEPVIDTLIANTSVGGSEDGLPTLLTESYLIARGRQASEVYNRLKRSTPGTISQLRSVLRIYEDVTEAAQHSESAGFIGTPVEILQNFQVLDSGVDCKDLRIIK